MTETAFDTARAELVRQCDCIDYEIAELQGKIDGLHSQRWGLLERIGGMEEARRLLTIEAAKPAPAPPTEPALQPERRRDVQRAVMALFTERDGFGHLIVAINEKGIVSHTGLPAASVHSFLLRAARDGKLVRFGDDEYRLPQGTESGVGAAEQGPVTPDCPQHAFEACTDGSGNYWCARTGCDWRHPEAPSVAEVLSVDARVLSSAEFVDQSNALRAALEVAWPGGIAIERTMVAGEVIEEAYIAGWAEQKEDDRGVPLVFLMLEPEAHA